MATTKKKAAKKAVKKAAPGGGELKAFREAVQNLSAAGKALARAARADGKLKGSSGLRVAVNAMLNTARAIAKSIPITTTPPPSLD